MLAPGQSAAGHAVPHCRSRPKRAPAQSAAGRACSLGTEARLGAGRYPVLARKHIFDLPGHPGWPGCACSTRQRAQCFMLHDGCARAPVGASASSSTTSTAAATAAPRRRGWGAAPAVAATSWALPRGWKCECDRDLENAHACGCSHHVATHRDARRSTLRSARCTGPATWRCPVRVTPRARIPRTSARPLAQQSKVIVQLALVGRLPGGPGSRRKLHCLQIP
jgi:hypothetical protein